MFNFKEKTKEDIVDQVFRVGVEVVVPEPQGELLKKIREEHKEIAGYAIQDLLVFIFETRLI